MKLMKIEIIEKRENELLGRTEITAKAIFEGATPSRSDIIKDIASQTKSKADMVIVRKINTIYGGLTAEVLVSIYKDKAQLEKVEKEALRKKNVVKEEPKEEAQPEEAVPAAEPAEAKAEGE